MALLREKRHRPRLECEVERIGTAKLVIAHRPPIVVAFHTVFQECLAIAPHFKWQWLNERVTEAHIRDPGPVECNDEDEVVPLDGLAASSATNCARYTTYVKPKGVENAAEQAIHLIAPAASTPVDEFGKDGRVVQRKRASDMDIEVLVGDGEEVGAVKCREGFDGGVERSGVLDAVEVAVEFGRGERGDLSGHWEDLAEVVGLAPATSGRHNTQMTTTFRLRVPAIAALCAIAAACASESGTPNDSAASAVPPAAEPAPSLEMRLDDPAEAASGVQMTPITGGVHVVTGPATILYNAADSVSGNYSVEASFQQMKAPTHPEAYGIFAAGANLTAANVSYLYFLVRRDGTWTVRHRADDKTVHTIMDWTANAAVQAEDSSGQATNALTMTFATDSVRFAVNGTQVHAVPRATLESGPDHAGTIGVAGIRVNHSLDVQVTGFRISRM